MRIGAESASAKIIIVTADARIQTITIYGDLHHSTRGTVVDRYVEEKVADMAVLHSWRE